MSILEYSKEEKYWIWLYSIDGVGVKNFNKLLAHFSSAEGVYENANLEELSKCIGQSLAKKIDRGDNVRSGVLMDTLLPSRAISGNSGLY